MRGGIKFGVTRRIASAWSGGCNRVLFRPRALTVQPRAATFLRSPAGRPKRWAARGAAPCGVRNTDEALEWEVDRAGRDTAAGQTSLRDLTQAKVPVYGRPLIDDDASTHSPRPAPCGPTRESHHAGVATQADCGRSGSCATGGSPSRLTASPASGGGGGYGFEFFREHRATGHHGPHADDRGRAGALAGHGGGADGAKGGDQRSKPDPTIAPMLSAQRQRRSSSATRAVRPQSVKNESTIRLAGWLQTSARGDIIPTAVGGITFTWRPTIGRNALKAVVGAMGLLSLWHRPGAMVLEESD